MARGHESVTVKSTGCGFGFGYIFISSLWCRGKAALSSATQYAMPPELGGKRGTEFLNTKFPLPTLLCAGYNVKLICFFYLYK